MSEGSVLVDDMIVKLAKPEVKVYFCEVLDVNGQESRCSVLGGHFNPVLGRALQSCARKGTSILCSEGHFNPVLGRALQSWARKALRPGPGRHFGPGLVIHVKGGGKDILVRSTLGRRLLRVKDVLEWITRSCTYKSSR